MQISELRGGVRTRLLGFAWDQWAQMGVFASSDRRDRWAMDPEALLLFTLEVGRADARLFEEVSDWMIVNETLIGVRRLRTALRRLARWLEDTSLDELSPYMLASRARDLGDEIQPLLGYSGVHFNEDRRPGADYWQSFCELANAALDSLP